MARSRNREAVLKTLRKALDEDSTKTFTAEISKLGLVEMTRQNVTEGVREIMSRPCPTCHGEGVIKSEETIAIEFERQLREIASRAKRGTEAFLVQVNPRVSAKFTGEGARVLHAAPSGAAREQQDFQGAGPDERGPAGFKLGSQQVGEAEFDGVHNKDGYYGGPKNKTAAAAALDPVGPGAGDSTGASDSNTISTSGSTGPAAGTSAGTRPYVDQAPGYTSTVTGAAAPPGTYKPKGDNLEDADVTESMPKPKTFTGDVGGVHDPGRLAEKDFESRTTATAGGGERATVGVGEEGGQYGVLQSESA